MRKYGKSYVQQGESSNPIFRHGRQNPPAKEGEINKFNRGYIGRGLEGSPVLQLPPVCPSLNLPVDPESEPEPEIFDFDFTVEKVTTFGDPDVIDPTLRLHTHKITLTNIPSNVKAWRVGADIDPDNFVVPGHRPDPRHYTPWYAGEFLPAAEYPHWSGTGTNPPRLEYYINLEKWANEDGEVSVPVKAVGYETFPDYPDPYPPDDSYITERIKPVIMPKITPTFNNNKLLYSIKTPVNYEDIYTEDSTIISQKMGIQSTWPDANPEVYGGDETRWDNFWSGVSNISAPMGMGGSNGAFQFVLPYEGTYKLVLKRAKADWARWGITSYAPSGMDQVLFGNLPVYAGVGFYPNGSWRSSGELISDEQRLAYDRQPYSETKMKFGQTGILHEGEITNPYAGDAEITWTFKFEKPHCFKDTTNHQYRLFILSRARYAASLGAYLGRPDKLAPMEVTLDIYQRDDLVMS